MCVCSKKLFCYHGQSLNVTFFMPLTYALLDLWRSLIEGLTLEFLETLCGWSWFRLKMNILFIIMLLLPLLVANLTLQFFPHMQAHKANVICPNKHQSDSEKFHKNRLLECETYIGGHVECLESGVFRSDIPIKFQFDPSAYEVHLQLYLLM